jgi:hypothetical protein
MRDPDLTILVDTRERNPLDSRAFPTWRRGSAQASPFTGPPLWGGGSGSACFGLFFAQVFCSFVALRGRHSGQGTAKGG